MKKIKSILVFAAAMMLAVICNATVRTADNNLGAPNDGVHNFSTLAAAYTASVNGDTIYVQGSSIIYPSLTLGKLLTLIGTGFNPASYPPKQNALYSTLASINFYTGCAGSKIIGFRLNSIYTGNNQDNHDVSIIRCMFISNYDGANNNSECPQNNSWIIEGCLFTNTGNFSLIGTCPLSNVIFRNNIISGSISVGSGFQVYNNIFLQSYFTIINTTGGSSNNNVYNNIFYGGNGVGTPGGLTFFYNALYISGGGSLPGAGNIVYTTTAPFFVSAAPGAFSFSNNYQIIAGSPLLTGGVSGAQQGVYGGTSLGAFTMTGFPALPNVLQFTVSPTNPTIPANAPLNVNIISKRIQ